MHPSIRPPMPFDIHRHAHALLQDYLRVFPSEHARFGLLQRQLAAGEDISVRSNMTGHLTSSAAVLSEDGSKVLLIDHAFLKKWLTPGGHYEGPDGLFESALREVAEETGVDDAVAHAWTTSTGIPLDIDSHDIPAQPRKNEAAHVHHDFLFLATAPERADLSAQLAEVHAAVWAPLEQLADSDDERVRRVYAKLCRLGVHSAARQAGIRRD